MLCLNIFPGVSEYTTDSLTQWDTDQVLQITGVTYTATPAIHFANKKSEKALVVTPTLEDGVLTVSIPNSLLKCPYPIIAYIYSYDNESGSTEIGVIIPVIPRVQPDDYIFVGDKGVLTLAAINAKVDTLISEGTIRINTMIFAKNEEFQNVITTKSGEVDSLIETKTKELDELISAKDAELTAIGEKFLAENQDATDLDGKIKRLIQVKSDISIPTSAWSTKSYTIIFDAITEDSIIDVYYNSSSKSAITDAEPTYTVQAGLLTITVVTAPTDTIVIDAIKVVNDI